MEATYSGLEMLAPGIGRLLAPNPSPFTYTGTQTYLLGEGELAIVDPGPDLPNHIAAIVRAIGGRRVAAIMCTHTHRDHSPASRALAAETGAPVVGCAALALSSAGPRADAAFDTDYRPDRALADGDAIEIDGRPVIAVATPGHTSNHLCFSYRDALFTGDHVMGWSTTVVFPPDGDMGDYIRSLDKLRGRDDTIYYPAHGAPVTKPQPYVRSLIGHRMQRERQILNLVKEAARTIPEIVERAYPGLDPRLVVAAGGSVAAHLLDLERRAMVHAQEDRWIAAA